MHSTTYPLISELHRGNFLKQKLSYSRSPCKGILETRHDFFESDEIKQSLLLSFSTTKTKSCYSHKIPETTDEFPTDRRLSNEVQQQNELFDVFLNIPSDPTWCAAELVMGEISLYMNYSWFWLVWTWRFHLRKGRKGLWKGWWCGWSVSRDTRLEGKGEKEKIESACI